MDLVWHPACTNEFANLSICVSIYGVCFEKFEVIWDIQGVSEILISFRNIITWPIIV